MIRLSAFADEISADPVDQLDVLDRNGIAHVEFRSIHGANVMDLDEARHREFRDLLRSRGFALSAIGSPIGKVAIGDPFGPHLDRFRLAMDLAEFHATPNVRVFSFYLPEGNAPSHHRDEVVSRMTEMTRMAEGRGLTLFLENERGIFGDTAARVLDLLEAVDSPSLVSAFDPANFLDVGQDVGEAWSTLKARVKHFHVKDFDPETKAHVPAGRGAGRIAELVADAVSRGYDGFCTLEPHLIVAARSHGFTGPERFGEAAEALKSELDRVGVRYA